MVFIIVGVLTFYIIPVGIGLNWTSKRGDSMGFAMSFLPGVNFYVIGWLIARYPPVFVSRLAKSKFTNWVLKVRRGQ